MQTKQAVRRGLFLLTSSLLFGSASIDTSWLYDSTEQTSPGRIAQLVARSRLDLASHLGVSQNAVTVIEPRHVIWPNSSAGCPRPGQEYQQMLTDGILIRLQANQREYQYNSGATGGTVLCKMPRISTGP